MNHQPRARSLLLRRSAHEPGFPWDVARLLAKQGLLDITIPEADGGQGGASIDAIVAIEQVAIACPRSADVVQAGNLGPIRALSQYGSKDQKARFLPPLLAGEGLIAVAMSEPEAGSAVTDLKTAAAPDGDGDRLSGSKPFTTPSVARPRLRTHGPSFLADASQY